MFLRLANDHEELLDYEPAVLETADLVVPPKQAAFVWKFVVGKTKALLLYDSATPQSQAQAQVCPVVCFSQCHETVSKTPCAYNKQAVCTTTLQSIQTDHL